MPFPRAACLLRGTAAAVCWAAAMRGEGLPPHWARPCLQRALPVRSTVWKELPGAGRVLAGEGIRSWGSGVERQSLYPHKEVGCCVGGCWAPHP